MCFFVLFSIYFLYNLGQNKLFAYSGHRFKKKEEISAYIMAKDLGGTVRLSLNRQIQPNSLFNVILECINYEMAKKK